LADIGLHDTHVLLGDKPGHSRNVPLNFYMVGAAVRGLHITSDYGLLTLELSQENDEWRQVQMSRGYIHSSSKSFDTSPNVFKIVASPKFPMFGSPLRLKASAPALAGSRDIDSARRIAAVSLRNRSVLGRSTGRRSAGHGPIGRSSPS
jgi:hypothetical protein